MARSSTTFKKGHKGFKGMLGKKHSEETLAKLRLYTKGHPAWNKGKTNVISKEARLKMSLKKLGKKASDETRMKMSVNRKGKKFTQETRERMSKARSGSGSSFWKGGITPMNEKIRKSLEYRLWREAVFERDNYTCIWCGLKNEKGLGKTIILHADYIKPFSLFPELRFAIDNGRTLCIDCHKTTDTYGGKIIKLKYKKLYE